MKNTIQIKLIRQYVQLLRVYNGRLLVIFFIFGKLISNSQFDIQIIWTCLALIGVYGLISISNYLYDQKIDQANAKQNPYGHLHEKNINRFYYAVATLTVAFAILSPNSWITLTATGAILIIGHFYSHPNFQLSHQPIPKFISMSLTYTYIPMFLGIFPNFNQNYLYTTIFFCLMASSWFLYSDIRDIRGDLLHGKITVANSLGIKKTALLAAVLGTSSYLLLIIGVSQLDILWIALAIFPISQWLAFYNNSLITNRRNLILLNYLWILFLILWITKDHF